MNQVLQVHESTHDANNSESGKSSRRILDGPLSAVAVETLHKLYHYLTQADQAVCNRSLEVQNSKFPDTVH